MQCEELSALPKKIEMVKCSRHIRYRCLAFIGPCCKSHIKIKLFTEINLEIIKLYLSLAERE